MFDALTDDDLRRILVLLVAQVNTNLADRRSAAWLWICIVLFEIGFTPLQYFRFLGFMPFLVVYLNSLASPAPAADRVLGARTAPR